MRRGQRRGPLGHPFPRWAQGGCRAGRPGGHTWATRLAAELPGCADRRPGEHRTSLLRLPRSPFSLLSFWSSFPLPPSLFSHLSLPFFTLFCLSLFSISLPFILKTTSFLCSLAFFLGGPSWLSSFLSCYYCRRACSCKPAVTRCAHIFTNLGSGGAAPQPRLAPRPAVGLGPEQGGPRAGAKPGLGNVALGKFRLQVLMVLLPFLVPAFITTSAFNKERTRQAASPQWSTHTQDAG